MQLPVSMYVRRRAGNVSSARADWAYKPPVNKPGRGRTAAQNAGLRFEQKALDFFTTKFNGFVPHLAFRFVSDYVSEVCIPDGILLAKKQKLLTVVEVKHRHTADAWFQLHQLYLPVVTKAFPGYDVQLLEVCKNYDPEVKLPNPFDLVEDLEKFIEAGGAYRFGVYLWSSR